MSDAATVGAMSDLLFDQVNPFTNVVWNSNLYARAIQKIAYEGADPAEAVAEAHKLLSEQVETARAEMT